RRRHTRWPRDWSSDVCSSDLVKFRLGIDYETLSKDHPRLVYASISGFGQSGPLATRPGFDQIAQGMGGLMSVTGLPGDGPVRVRSEERRVGKGGRGGGVGDGC